MGDCAWCGRSYNNKGFLVDAYLDTYCCGEKCAREWFAANRPGESFEDYDPEAETDAAYEERDAELERFKVRMRFEVENADFQQLIGWIDGKNDPHVKYLEAFFRWDVLTPDQWVSILCREGGCRVQYFNDDSFAPSMFDFPPSTLDFFMLAEKHCKFEDFSPQLWSSSLCREGGCSREFLILVEKHCKFGDFSPQLWVSILCREGGCSGALFMLAEKHCKFEDFSPQLWVSILCRKGGCSSDFFMLADKHCRYEDFPPEMWKQLFSLRGRGVVLFDEKSHIKYISNYDVETQGEILGVWDCHADNYNNLIGECTSRNAALWAQILLHPSFLINGDVVHLQDLEKINWKGLEGLPPEMWIRLALFRKEFAQHLNWSHFNKGAAKTLRFSSRDIFRLISYCEDVARVYPISELDTSDLTVEELRSVSDKVREDIAKSAGFALWPKLSMAFVRLDWKRFKLPEQKVLDKFSSDEWGRVLNKRPDLQSVVPDSVLDRFDAYAWYEALAGVGGKRYRQQLRNRMHSPDRIAWTKLGVKCWAWLLRDFPDLAPWFDDKMYYDEYANKAGKPIDPEQILIIGVIPDLACDFDRWDEIPPGWWPYLLERQPQFSEKCPVSAWRKMTRKDVRAIFKAQPKLRKYRRYCKGGGCLWRIVKAVCLISVLVLGLESGVSYIKKAYDGYGRDGDKVASAVEYYERSRDSVVALIRQLWN